jgi:hypothetical protein
VYELRQTESINILLPDTYRAESVFEFLAVIGRLNKTFSLIISVVHFTD